MEDRSGAEWPLDVPFAVELISTQDQIVLKPGPVVVIESRASEVSKCLHEQAKVLVVDPAADHAREDAAALLR